MYVQRVSHHTSRAGEVEGFVLVTCTSAAYALLQSSDTAVGYTCVVRPYGISTVG